MEETKKNWGKPFSIIGLVFGIISLVFGLFSIIPVLGIAFAVITGILTVIAITMAIPGIIGSIGKGKPFSIGIWFNNASLGNYQIFFNSICFSTNSIKEYNKNTIGTFN